MALSGKEGEEFAVKPVMVFDERKVILCTLIASFLIASGSAAMNHGWTSLLVFTATVAILWMVVKIYSRQTFNGYIISLLFSAISVLLIVQAKGALVVHFACLIFVVSLIVFKEWKIFIPFLLLVSMAVTVLFVLQNSGRGPYLMEEYASLRPRFLAAYLIVLVINCSIAGFLAFTLRKLIGINDAINSKLSLLQELPEMLTELHREQSKTYSDDSAEMLLKLVLEALPDPAFISDSNHKVLFANERYKALHGPDGTDIPSSAETGSSFEGRGEEDVLHEPVWESGNSIAFEEKVMNDGKVFNRLVTKKIIGNGTGKLFQVTVYHDITAVRQAEGREKRYLHRLLKVNKELNQFTYVASHDLKAPLRAITSLSEWIEEDQGEHISEDAAKKMRMLRGRVSRMESLINGILQYSKSTRTRIRIEMVDSDKVLEEVLEGMSVPEGFTIVKETDLPVINNNRVWVQQLFFNLIDNAVRHHNRQTGSVRIRYEEGQAFHIFTITDDGPGIPAAFHDKVFEIFQTLEARDKVENTGIGLAIVKKIVEEQGGTVQVKSSLGSGTSMIVSLPKEVVMEDFIDV